MNIIENITIQVNQKPLNINPGLFINNKFV